MLIELRIRDYAVIEDLTLRLGAGLIALSGETGAGKSIIVGALALLVGERASSQVVRRGADRAVVEAVFEVDGVAGLGEYLQTMGYAGDDGLLILRREVAAEGRNRAWVNGSPATAASVGELGTKLLDIHGQHEHQPLLKAREQRTILDGYAGAAAQAGQVEELHAELSRRRAALEDKAARLRELEARADFLRFQREEIQSAGVREGEEVELEEEASRLDHAEELAGGTRDLHESLYAGEGSLSDRVAELRSALERLARLDPSLERHLDSLEEAYHLLADTGQRLGSYASGVEADPRRLEAVRRRQDLLFRLKRKYGPDLSDVLATGLRVSEELKELEGAGFDVRELEEGVDRARREFMAAVGELSRRRTVAARKLEEEVMELLPGLGLPGSTFQVQLTALQEPGAGGGERVEFLASLNPGFPPGPLARIASGGELSRVMLALKTILAGVDRIPTLIFDEIDSGVGGEVALQVAGKLREVAAHHQVFVITHLPQLASRAHHQLFVTKGESDGLASTAVRELEGEERVREVARMLGGDPESSTSREHARELLGAG